MALEADPMLHAFSQKKDGSYVIETAADVSSERKQSAEAAWNAETLSFLRKQTTKSCRRCKKEYDPQIAFQLTGRIEHSMDQ